MLWSEDDEDELANVLCQTALDFEMFLSPVFLPSNNHLKLVVNFLLVSSDFLEFVGAYRLQDSITIENGYKSFAPIWKILWQVKYLEPTWMQMDYLYGNFPYSWMQEIRMNWHVRMYPGATGKFALAQDEWLELNNTRNFWTFLLCKHSMEWASNRGSSTRFVKFSNGHNTISEWSNLLYSLITWYPERLKKMTITCPLGVSNVTSVF